MENETTVWMTVTIIIFGLITVEALIYAIVSSRERKRRESQIQEHLAGLAGDIARIQFNPLWADKHLSDIRDICLQNPASEQVRQIIVHAHDAARDVTAAERMLGNLLNEVVSLQRGLFGTERVVYTSEGSNPRATVTTIHTFKTEPIPSPMPEPTTEPPTQP